MSFSEVEYIVKFQTVFLTFVFCVGMSLDSDNEYDSEAENSQQDGEENFDGGEEDASDDDKGHQSSCTCPASQLLQKYGECCNVILPL